MNFQQLLPYVLFQVLKQCAHVKNVLFLSRALDVMVKRYVSYHPLCRLGLRFSMKKLEGLGLGFQNYLYFLTERNMVNAYFK